MKFANKVHIVHVFVLFYFLLNANSNSTSIQRSTYIVYMDKLVMPKVFTNHSNWYSSIIKSFKFLDSVSFDSHQSFPSILYTYEYAFHGFCVVLTLNELEVLKKFPGFISAHNDGIVKLDTTYTPNFLSLNPSTGIWLESNRGANTIIGIIDSGIWPESLSFKDHGMKKENPDKWNGTCEGGEDFNSSMCNFKIIGARYFNLGLKLFFGNITDSAKDTEGHGTYVASIAAGNYVKNVSFSGYAKGTAKGVAPLAKLAIYRVTWPQGALESDIAAGINQAIHDGVDVISVSLKLRAVYGIFEDPVALASFSAMMKGILVSTSAGNEGPNYGSIHKWFPWVLAVGSGTIDRWFAGILTFGNGLTITGWSMFLGDSLLEPHPLVYNRTLAACNSTALLSEAPKGIILCDIGDIASQLKSIISSNILGAILVYSEPKNLGLREVPCRCVVIREKDAPTVVAYTQGFKNPNVIMKFKETIIEIKHAPIVPFYSARGPSRRFQNILKPDVIAPGSLVLAASIPLKPSANKALMPSESNYTIVSGTSYACPHVSGVAALLKSIHPEWSPAAIRSAIMTTANILDNSQNPIKADGNSFEDATPFDMGAGHINPNRAFDPGLIYDATTQDYMNLLCTLPNRHHQRFFRIIALSTKIDNCLNPSSDLNYPSFISLYNDSTTPIVEIFQRTVTNVGDGPAIYMVKVTAPQNSSVTVSPKILEFKKKYEKQSYNVTIEHRGNEKRTSTFGSLLWVEQSIGLQSNHRVRSPIIVTPWESN